MRINASADIIAQDVLNATAMARSYGQDIVVDEYATSPRGAITFYLGSLNGRYATNRPSAQGLRAASWTAWGYVIADLFNQDPNAKIGQYNGVDDFAQQCEDASERYLLRRRLGHTREGEPGQDISFLDTLETDIYHR